MAATLWTPEWIRQNFLFGVNLADDYANDYPEEMWAQAMALAEMWIATELDLAIPVATFTERHDFITPDSGFKSFIQTTKFPIRSITSLTLNIGRSQIMQIPADWIANYRHNQVQIVPSANTIASYPLTALGFWQTTAYSGQDVPGLYEIIYSAGFNIRGTATTYSVSRLATTSSWTPATTIAFNGPLTITLSAARATATSFVIYGADAGTGKLKDGRRHGNAINDPETVTIPAGQTVGVSTTSWSSISAVTFTALGSGTATIVFSGASLDMTSVDIPRDILGAMGKRAACDILVIAGNLISGAGIASKSTGLDGVSQSINTTSSPENTGYQAQIRMYETQLKRELPMIRRRYHGIQLGVA